VIVYEAEKHKFVRDVQDRAIDEIVHKLYRERTGHSVGSAELRSWRESLQSMSSVLNDPQLPDDLGIAVEFILPQSSKRIDITVAGLSDDGTRRAVIVELKQWETVLPTEQDGMVLTRLGGAERLHVHPSYQAWSYAAFLRGFNEAVYDGGIGLEPCAYLHNYRRDGVLDGLFYKPYLDQAPLFAKGEQVKLRHFIRQHVPHGGGRAVLRDLDRARIRPSKALADAVVGMVRGNQEFVLLDDQKVVYEAALKAAREATPGAPRVIIVEGGPGTGKSVVAVQLVAALLSARTHALYVSKNAAPRRVFVEKLGKEKKDHVTLASLFTGPDRFMNAKRDTYGAVVVDESHRLTEKGGFYGNQGDHLVKDIIRAATCAIFFIDEDQRVTLRDIGSKELIRDFAKERGAAIEEYELASQFRCSGSNGYLAWLDDTLDIRETANPTLEGSGYDFHVFDDPSELHAAIERKNDRNKARVVAGYCWPWRSKKDPAALDIVIGDYAKRWNLTDDGSLWIIAPDSVREVGCVHTCQGLEVDYIGVIIGPDILYRNNRVTTVPDARDRHDKSMRGFKKWRDADPEGAGEAADRIIKNTYRTLMTRGMKGCFVFATDPELREFLRKRAGNF